MSKETSKIQINIESEKKRFKEHINLKDNNNIFFSGVFGSGKTYFLERFFRENNNRYECYMISPVKYSISPSENIFSYIKFDIGFQLFSNGISFEKTNYTFTQTSLLYIENNFQEFLESILSVGSKTNQKLNVVYSLIKFIKKKIQKLSRYNNMINVDDQNDLLKFLFSLTTQKNSLFEEDLITQMISYYVNNSDKEKVLIIDDLDRLDPDHIFRLLNVFSSHLEFENSEVNKLGFNKLILVGDVNNIRKIYHHKFGKNVDFEGYFDKFYSQEVFVFDNKTIVDKTIKDIVVNSIDNQSNTLDKSSIVFIISTLSKLVFHSDLNLRTLLNLSEIKFSSRIKKLIVNDNMIFNSRDYRFYEICTYFYQLMGDDEKILNYFKKLSQNYPVVQIRSEELNNELGHLISFLKVGTKVDTENSYNVSENNFMIDYKVNKNSTNEFITVKINSINNNKIEPNRYHSVPLGQLLINCYNNYLSFRPYEEL